MRKSLNQYKNANKIKKSIKTVSAVNGTQLKLTLNEAYDVNDALLRMEKSKYSMEKKIQT